MDFKGERIWIIGASSGIGRDLVIKLSEAGANIILSARRKDELIKLNNELENSHKVLPVDVANYSDVQKAVKTISRDYKKIDRVIYLAAIYAPKSIYDIDIEFAQKSMEVNFLGALYIMKEMLPILNKQDKAQIVICGSVAGYTGLPNGQPYSATKAALINYTESLYAETPEKIDVKLISPGFVETPMTNKNEFDMPMIISSSKAAHYIARGLNARSFEIHFPKRFTYMLKIISSFPYWLSLPLIKKLKRD